MKKLISVFLCIVISLFTTVTCLSATTQEKPFDNSNFFTKGDYTIHYRSFEPENDPCGQVLFLHGFGLSTASFCDMVGYFTEAGYRCVLVDLPNAGYSTRETAKTKPIPREELVTSLMDSLGGEWVLAGHSMGGGVALNIAASSPSNLKALALYCPQTTAALTPTMMKLMRSPLATGIFEAIISLGSRNRLLMRLVAMSAIGDREYLSSYDISEISTPLQIRGTGAGMAIMTTNATPTDFEKVKEINLPVLLIKGTDDNVASEDNLQQIEAALQGEKTLVLEGGNHMFLQVMAERTARETLGFLEANKSQG